MTLLPQRTAARAWVTRSKNSLRECSTAEVVVAEVIRAAINDFDQRMSKLNEVQEQYEVEVPDINGEVEEAGTFRDEAMEVRLVAIQVLKQLETSEGASEANSSLTALKAKLPKLELPTFDGTVLDWPSFWDQFKATVHESNLPEVTKFTYLRSLLRKEALETVKGFSTTAEHYKEACTLLEKRFGRRERIVLQHIQELLELVNINKASTDVQVLRKLQDKVESHIRSLVCLEISGDKYGVVLTPIVLSCLPYDIRLMWARQSEGKESDLKWLMEFLDKELKLKETSQSFKPKATENPKMNVVTKRPSTTAALTSVSLLTCNVCNKEHPTSRCWELTERSVTEREDIVMKYGLCICCLSNEHIKAKCDKTCSNCGNAHHYLLCYRTAKFKPPKKPTTNFHKKKEENSKEVEKKKEISKKKEENTTTGSCSHCTGVLTLATRTSPEVILQTAKLQVKGKNGVTDVQVLFDSGCGKTHLISEKIKEISPEFLYTEYQSSCAFGHSKPSKETLKNIFKVQIKSETTGWFDINVTQSPVICAPLYKQKVPNHILESFQEKPMCEVYNKNENMIIHMVIGLDYYWKFVMHNDIVLLDEPGNHLVAQQTKFGWIMSGCYSGNSTRKSADTRSHTQMLCVHSVDDSQLRKIWDCDVEKDDVTHDEFLKNFQSNIQWEEDKYEVALPWKNESEKKLMNNYYQAKMRLNSLMRKFNKDPEMKRKYDKVFQDMEDENIIEEVPKGEVITDNPVFYMPHRGVQSNSTSTPLRPVFDASAEGPNGWSLNDCIETGPNLIPSLIDIIIRFRRWRIAIVADIRKAFHQIAIRPQDRDVHRFLWERDGQIRIMRFTRVPFGNTASPFILNATIKHHLNKYSESHVVEDLDENLYVDDWITGADEEEDGVNMMEEGRKIMAEGNWELTKWNSSNKDIIEQVTAHETPNCEEKTTTKVLGLKWDKKEDCFLFEGQEMKPLQITKRTILSIIARLFDPIGWIQPFIIKLKCLFQELWILGVQWDEVVPAEIEKQVLSWIEDLGILKEYKIPRSYTGGKWKDIAGIRLEAFGDASNKAYGACVYLVAMLSNGSTKSMLIIAKSRVCPLKLTTLPRLELLGALLAALLMYQVKVALKGEITTRYWTDSTCVWNWIRGDPKKYKTFVSNRVSRIQELTNPSEWNTCPGINNPADLLTRGITASDLVTSDLWLYGPDFIHDSKSPPANKEDGMYLVTEDSLDADNFALVEHSKGNGTEEWQPQLPIASWSSLKKALRIVAYVLRFYKLASKKTENRQNLTLQELAAAESTLFRQVQREHFSEEIENLKNGKAIPNKSFLHKYSPYLDEENLLRVKGRLDYSPLSYSEKNPIIIPKSHFADMIVRDEHLKLKHAGVNTLLTSIRNKFWIVGARSIAKRIKRECIDCQRLDARPITQPIAPLHETRVLQGSPFATVGIDHAGPLFCCDQPGKKLYILLFTCSVTRALHLELVNSLNLTDCILAIKRFISRRGIPKSIWSDNAKTFMAAKQYLLNLMSTNSPEWNFIIPRSPWWGGWWERLVRSTKSALKKSIGKNSLTRAELETSLHEVEACINSRPLTYVSDDVENYSPLTPACFLIGRSSFFQVPEQDTTVDNSADMIKNRILMRNITMDRFWSLWTTEYLRQLPQFKGSSNEKKLLLGEVVLIKEDNAPRLYWPVWSRRHTQEKMESSDHAK